jgi:SAM-dependent methyltransferase
MDPTARDEAVAVNRAHWEAVTPGHVASAFYDVPSFLAGRDTIDDLEEAAVGPVAGKTLLHLQCHFGLDTISWARRGAIVTGVDFALPAVETARRLAAETGVTARFVHSDVYRLPDVLDGEFDVVFASHGVLGWLPDLRPWGEVVARFLAPGGRFALVDSHPVLWMFDDEREDGEMRLRYPYFSGEPLEWEGEGSYADPGAPRTRVVEYAHPLEEVLGSLIDAGLRIEAFREYDRLAWKALPHMVQSDDGWWRLPPDAVSVPLMFSVRATRDA